MIRIHPLALLAAVLVTVTAERLSPVLPDWTVLPITGGVMVLLAAGIGAFTPTGHTRPAAADPVSAQTHPVS